MKYILAMLLMITLFLTPFCLARAGQSPASPGYSLGWSSMDGGGGYSTGGSYSLQGAIGQPEAGSLQGGNYSLAGGFWPAFKQPWLQYLPNILKAP